jgi:hypothetical protein
LLFAVPGSAGKMTLSPESETTFSVAGQPIEFVKDGNGAVTHFVIHLVEGDQKGLRTGDLPK